MQIITLAMNDQKEKLWEMLTKLQIYDKLKSEERELVGKPLMKRIMQVHALSVCVHAVAGLRRVIHINSPLLPRTSYFMHEHRSLSHVLHL